MRTILHVDLDAFFASAELTRHPEWRGKPVVVGSGPHERGVVSTCSYEARRFGVHSAMPSRTAYERCPNAIFTPPDMPFYHAISKRAFAVFEDYSPFVEAVSVDEAFLDITGTIHLHDDVIRLGEALRADVFRACGVTCSVGIAPNRLLAKIGSEQNKPDGLTLMPFEPNAIAAFLAPKPVGILWGVGHKTIDALKPYGITTCRNLQQTPVERLAAILGPAAAHHLHEYAFGRSSDRVARDDENEKSVSREHTFAFDEPNREVVRARLLALVEDVGRRFRRETRWARTARLRLRDASFKTFTRQAQFPSPARDDTAFRAAAINLFDRIWPNDARRRTVRLVGFGVADFQQSPDDDAPSLFTDPHDENRERRERLSQAIDFLHDKGLDIHHGQAHT